MLRRVVDRNDGPLSDEVLVRLFREIMSACLAQQEPLKIGYLGPEGTFSQQAVHKHFGHSAHGLPLASIEEVFQEVEAGHADFGVVPVENSGQGTIQSTLDMFLTSHAEDLRRSRAARAPVPALAQRPHRGHRARLLAPAVVRAVQGLAAPVPAARSEKIAVASNAEAARRARNADDAAAIAGEQRRATSTA